MKYEDIEEAFSFVNSAGPEEHLAVIHRATGKVYICSVVAGEDHIPEEAYVSDDYLWIPHKNDLDLGKALVVDFVRVRCPELLDPILAIFRRRGAYGRFKGLLEEKGLLKEWYSFEEEMTREALKKWAKKNGVDLE